MRISDWSSDVCSSDLLAGGRQVEFVRLPLFRLFQKLVASSRPGLGRRLHQFLRCRCFRGGQGFGWQALALRRRQWRAAAAGRSEEHTSELQSLMRISYAVFCLKKKTNYKHTTQIQYQNTTVRTTIR